MVSMLRGDVLNWRKGVSRVPRTLVVTVGRVVHLTRDVMGVEWQVRAEDYPRLDRKVSSAAAGVILHRHPLMVSIAMSGKEGSVSRSSTTGSTTPESSIRRSSKLV
jgi:hypothetical protein